MNQLPERCPPCGKSYGYSERYSDHKQGNHNWRLFAYHIDTHTRPPIGRWRCYCGWTAKQGRTSADLIKHLQDQGVEHLILAAVAKVGGDT